MEHILSVEEVEALETTSLNDLEIELHYLVFIEKQVA